MRNDLKAEPWPVPAMHWSDMKHLWPYGTTMKEAFQTTVAACRKMVNKDGKPLLMDPDPNDPDNNMTDLDIDNRKSTINKRAKREAELQGKR